MINNNKLKFLEKKPSIDNTVFIANGSKIIGDVVIKKKVVYGLIVLCEQTLIL